MESTTATLNPQLTGQLVQNQIREIGINPNYWYAVAWAKDIAANEIIPVKIWNQEIALYRDQQGKIQAVEDICPHKGVSMHKGNLNGDRIVCGYHGWEFEHSGECAHIPYFPSEQKLPRACLRVYPVQERYGLIFIFPGDSNLAETTPVIDIPQYDDPNYLMIPIEGEFNSHYTICNENTMDVFHGHLHQNLQGWYNPILKKLQETNNSIYAEYQVSYSGIMTKFLGMNDSSGETTQTIAVDYQYPNYINTLKGSSFLYLMRLPIDAGHSRSFAMMFVKVRIPRWILDPIRTVLEPVIRERFFMRFLRQDIEMIESEYEHYQQDPLRRYVEVNPAIIAVQRLMRRQYEEYIAQQSEIPGKRKTAAAIDLQAG